VKAPASALGFERRSKYLSCLSRHDSFETNKVALTFTLTLTHPERVHRHTWLAERGAPLPEAWRWDGKFRHDGLQAHSLLPWSGPCSKQLAPLVKKYTHKRIKQNYKSYLITLFIYREKTTTTTKTKLGNIFLNLINIILMHFHFKGWIAVGKWEILWTRIFTSCKLKFQSLMI
jgi:hypothetical protein